MEEIKWSPPELLKVSGSYWSACAVHAGVKLDLFTPLSRTGFAAADLAEQIGVDPRGLAMLLDALAALGLLVKTDATYRCTEFSAQFLAKTSPGYLGHIILHHHHLVDGWARLDEAVRTGQPARRRVSHEASAIERESFLLGMFNLAMLLAPQVVKQIDLASRSHLLDLGGGPGTYAIHFCLQNPGLRATVYDLPGTRIIAEETIRQFKLAERIDFLSGDFQEHPIPGRYDTAWLSHVLHGEGEEGCHRMLGKTVNALDPGGLLMVQEFILDDRRDRPVFPALFSLNMLLGTPAGKSYSEGEIRQMLSTAGLERIERLALELPNGAGVICGYKPKASILE